ncbi:MAG: hypothetical protein LBH40_01505 [Alphaproteobacteria bacterium]|nr:hypothetical protein [Alphaproteobacteria bacterium]
MFRENHMVEGWLKVEDLEITLLNLGGAGSLQDIYKELSSFKGFELNQNQKAKVRQQLQYYSADSN